jgi:hypothetical protein
LSTRQRLTAKRQIAEWLWRLALLAALAWIGRELRLMHEDMLQPAGRERSASFVQGLPNQAAHASDLRWQRSGAQRGELP